MTNKYLEKIAEEKKKDGHWHIPGAVLSTVTGGLVTGLAAAPLHGMVSAKVRDAVHAPQSDSGADRHTVRKFMRDNNLHHNTTFNTREHSLNKSFGNFGHNPVGRLFKGIAGGGMPGPAYVPVHHMGGHKSIIGGVRGMHNHDVTMHELGHAKDFQSFGKLKLSAALLKSPVVSKGATFAALANDKTRDYAPAVAAIPGLLTLRDEAAANYHAYHGIKAHKGAAAANKFVRKLLPSQMGTYALGAAAPVAATYVAKKILDVIHPKKKPQ